MGSLLATLPKMGSKITIVISLHMAVTMCALHVRSYSQHCIQQLYTQPLSNNMSNRLGRRADHKPTTR